MIKSGISKNIFSGCLKQKEWKAQEQKVRERAQLLDEYPLYYPPVPSTFLFFVSTPSFFFAFGAPSFFFALSAPYFLFAFGAPSLLSALRTRSSFFAFGTQSLCDAS